MNEIKRGQVNGSAAEVYDEFFLPALFKQWPERVLETAQVGPGHRVLDVACGTGVLTLAAAEKVAPEGAVAGLDINVGMLGVARRKAPEIEWRHGQAESLPFPDSGFDRVISQFGLMFFDDRRAALREMMRVLRPGGRLAIAVWDRLENAPGYAAVTGLLQRLFGNQAAEAIRAPFNLGDTQALGSLFSGIRLEGVKIDTYPGTARFPSLEAWMYTDVKGWTLDGVIDERQFDLLLEAAESELREFAGDDGSVAFEAPAHIVTGYKA